MRIAVACISLGVIVAGCSLPRIFRCTDSSECAGGQCEPVGHCSLADNSCDSGRRYSSFAGAFADVCVGEEPHDAGVFDAGPNDPDADADGSVPPDAIRIRAGNSSTCALFPDGSVRCWGTASAGALGDPAFEHIGDEPSEMPPAALALGGAVKDLGLGTNFGCALMESGAVRCWGESQYGYVGNGDPNDDIGDQAGEMPPPDVNVGGKAIALAVGAGHSCAIIEGGWVRCWGLGNYGMLGDPNEIHVGDAPGEMPPISVPLGQPATAVAAGFSHTCALLEDRSVQCWGRGAFGQLGTGSGAIIGDDVDELPNLSVPLVGGASAIAAGFQHSCALVEGEVYCWGQAEELGINAAEDLGDDPGEVPTTAVTLGGSASHLRSHHRHTCVVVAGEVKCWGQGLSGKLGNESEQDILTDPPALGLGAVIREVATGKEHTCAVTVENEILCWGSGALGALGYGDTANVGDTAGSMPPSPVTVQ